MEFDSLSNRVIGCALEVHRHLRPGLLESAYEICLAHEMSRNGIRFQTQWPLPIAYKDVQLDCGYRIDILIEGSLIVELKSVDRLLPIHDAQLLTSMKLANVSIGLLLNFNVKYLKEGIRRTVLRTPFPLFQHEDNHTRMKRKETDETSIIQSHSPHVLQNGRPPPSPCAQSPSVLTPLGHLSRQQSGDRTMPSDSIHNKSRLSFVDSTLIISFCSLVAYGLGFLLLLNDASSLGLRVHLLPQPSVQEMMAWGLIALLLACLPLFAIFALGLRFFSQFEQMRRLYEGLKLRIDQSRQLYFMIAVLLVLVYLVCVVTLFAPPRFANKTLTNEVQIEWTNGDTRVWKDLVYLGRREGFILLWERDTQAILLMNEKETKSIRISKKKIRVDGP